MGAKSEDAAPGKEIHVKLPPSNAFEPGNVLSCTSFLNTS
jgi:hypothetical protein